MIRELKSSRSGVYLLIARRVILVLLLAAGIGVALAAYKRSHDRLHDLSAIGNGTPTVVQIHDPDCPSCKQLLENLRQAAGGIDDRDLQVRVASLRTAAGRALARRHGVPHVTLLYFDGAGALSNSHTGVLDVNSLRSLLKGHQARR